MHIITVRIYILYIPTAFCYESNMPCTYLPVYLYSIILKLQKKNDRDDFMNILYNIHTMFYDQSFFPYDFNTPQSFPLYPVNF